MFTGACPKCNTGTLIRDDEEREFYCLNCAFRIHYDKRMNIDRSLCHGSGLSIVIGSERKGSGGGTTGRCTGCGRVIATLIGRNLTIKHAPKLGAGDRRPNGSYESRKKSYGVRS